MQKILLPLSIIVLMLSACVTPKIHNALHTEYDKAKAEIEKKDKKEAIQYLPKLNSELMRVAKTGIIKKKNASRNISRITKKINSI